MGFEHVIAGWEPLTQDAAAAEFQDARREAQWAARLAGAVGEARAAALPDFGHVALSWDAPRRVLVGPMTPGGYHVELRLAPLELHVVEAAGGRESIPLAGLTLASAHEALAVATAATARAARGRGEPPFHASTEEIEAHPVGAGAPFGGASAEALAELERWYANTARVAAALVAAEPSAGPVRLWPHHFDLAVLLSLGPNAAGEERSIGFGMAPGDGSYAEPYFYVSPWPVADESALPPLAGPGHWHTTDFVSAVLPFARLKGLSGPAQAEAVHHYLRAALAACRQVLALD